MSLGVSVFLFVPKNYTYRWTDMVLLLSEASHFKNNLGFTKTVMNYMIFNLSFVENYFIRWVRYTIFQYGSERVLIQRIL